VIDKLYLSLHFRQPLIFASHKNELASANEQGDHRSANRSTTRSKRKCYFANGKSDPQVGNTATLSRSLASLSFGARAPAFQFKRLPRGARVGVVRSISSGPNGIGKLELLPITTLSDPVVVRASLEVIPRNSSITFTEYRFRSNKRVKRYYRNSSIATSSRIIIANLGKLLGKTRESRSRLVWVNPFTRLIYRLSKALLILLPFRYSSDVKIPKDSI